MTWGLQDGPSDFRMFREVVDAGVRRLMLYRFGMVRHRLGKLADSIVMLMVFAVTAG